MQMPGRAFSVYQTFKLLFLTLKWIREMLGWGRAVTCMWGDRFPVSSGTSWLSSAACMLCLEMFLWQLSKNSVLGSPVNRCGGEGWPVVRPRLGDMGF